MKSKLKIITILFLIISTFDCQSQQFKKTTIPYEVGQSYVYKTTVTDSNSTLLMTDTLTLTIKKEGIIGGLLGMNMAEWKSKKFPQNKQTRGVNLTANSVEIQMPIHYDYLENENLVIAGYPSFSKSMLIGHTSISTHQFPKSYGKLAGKEIEQYKIVVDSSTTTYKGKIVNCKVAEYKNQTDINELGAYKLKTFYNNEFGFLKINYKYPNGKKIKFELIEIKNEP